MTRSLLLSRRVPYLRGVWNKASWLIGWWCWYVEALWEPRDMWVGVFWRRPMKHERDLELFVCLLPCLPIRIHVWDDSDVPF